MGPSSPFRSNAREGKHFISKKFGKVNISTLSPALSLQNLSSTQLHGSSYQPLTHIRANDTYLWKIETFRNKGAYKSGSGSSMTDEMFSISFFAYTRASSVVNDRRYLYKVGDNIQEGKTGRRRRRKKERKESTLS